MKIEGRDQGKDFILNITECPLELRRKIIEYLRPELLYEDNSYKKDLDVLIDTKDVSQESEKAFGNITKLDKSSFVDIDKNFISEVANNYLTLRLKDLDDKSIDEFDNYAADYFAKQFLPYLNNDLLDNWQKLKLEEKKKAIKDEVQKINNPN